MTYDRWFRAVTSLALSLCLGACAATEPLPQFYLLTPSIPDGAREHLCGILSWYSQLENPGKQQLTPERRI